MARNKKKSLPKPRNPIITRLLINKPPVGAMKTKHKILDRKKKHKKNEY